jgi:hypothetical protein
MCSMPTRPGASSQCVWLLARIDELAREADLEDDPKRASQWLRERRSLLRRAADLGCLCSAVAAPGIALQGAAGTP